MKKFLLIGLSAAVLLAVLPATSAQANPDHKVTICHANEGVKGWSPNGNSVDKDSIMNPLGAGHDSHANDIIPAFAAGSHANKSWDAYPGKNLTTLFDGVLGSAILANGCAIPEIPTPPNVVIIPPSIDHNDACGVGNLVVNVPESTDQVTWMTAIADPSNTVHVTATATEGNILTINGEDLAVSFSWEFADSAEPCSVPTETTTPTPPVETPKVPEQELAHTGLSPIGGWLAVAAGGMMLLGGAIRFLKGA